MNYKIVDINGNPEYILKGIKLNNTSETCIYWTNKNVEKINEVIVLLKNNNIRNIKNNQICISLNGINNINSQKECLKAFCSQLKAMDINAKEVTFVFVISSKLEEPIIKELNDSLGLNSKVFIPGSAKKTTQIKPNVEKKEVEKKLDNEEELKGKSNIVDITKYKNEKSENIILDKKEKNAIDLSQEKLTLREMMKAKYKELMQDPIEKEKLHNMSDEEVIEYVSSLIKIGRAKHQIKDGEINTNVGVGINDPSKQNDITILEKDGDETKVKELDSNKVDMNKPNSSNTNNTSNVIPIQTVNKKPRKNPARTDTKIFEKPLVNDNAVSKEKHKVKTKTLKVNKNAAFANVPVIIFVISMLLLIASIVIWFITK